MAVHSTVGSFIANLPEMLGAMVVDPRCLVAVIEFEDVRYVQYWVERDGAVIAEVDLEPQHRRRRRPWHR